MKITALNERIEKKEAAIAKKQNTISKKEKAVTKKKSEMAMKFGITFNKQVRLTTDELEKLGLTKDQAWDAYWLQCEIDGLMQDLERLPKEIEKMNETLDKYKKQLSGEAERESTFICEIPESMKEMQNQLVTEWDRWDNERKAKLASVYKKVGYTAFFKGTEENGYRDKHTYADYEFLNMTSEKIHESNMELAKAEIIDLYNRVKEKTGEVTDWSGIELRNGNSFPVLTGWVSGAEGSAFVETVIAGGYNIQRRHIRVLVK